MGVIVWSPLNGGWLTGKYKRGQEYPKGTRASWGLMDGPETAHNQRKFDAVEQLEKVAADAGISLTHLVARVEHRAPGRHVDDHRPEDDGAARRPARRRRRDARAPKRSTASTRSSRPAARCTRPTTATNRPTSRRPPAVADPHDPFGRNTMKQVRLGRTALRVSQLCLGTMNFGPLTTEPDSFAIMDHALELGINFFDTANRYGGDEGCRARPRRSSATGSRRAAAGARRSCSRRRCSAR